MRSTAWVATGVGRPMVREERDVAPGAGEVVVEVAGCGVCHTDLGFLYDGVPTRRPFPLVLGHEIAGRVVETGDGADGLRGREVVVPAVLPCGECDACRAGRGQVCPSQVFLGSDVDGGFATHVRVPARGLCPVPAGRDMPLAHLAVVADAVSTPYQAILRSGLGAGDLAVFVGAGGLGGFGVQIAAALGAAVVAVDVDDGRLRLAQAHGASLALRADRASFKEIRDEIRGLAARRAIPTWRQRVFETSGAAAGQATAFGLLGPGGHLAVVGFTPAKLELRLSNVMAFDATVQGNWGCLPEHYPAVVDLVVSGRVALEPFVEVRPLDAINETFADVHERRTSRRVVLTPAAAS